MPRRVHSPLAYKPAWQFWQQSSKRGRVSFFSDLECRRIAMRRTVVGATVLATVLLAGCAAKKQEGFPKGEWIDLSHDFAADTIYWPTAEPFKLETVSAGINDKGFYYSA